MWKKRVRECGHTKKKSTGFRWIKGSQPGSNGKENQSEGKKSYREPLNEEDL